MKTYLAIVFLLAAGFFVYANALPNGFVWDDQTQVVKNTVVRDWNNLTLIFSSSTFYAGGAGLTGGFYRPFVSLSYLLNYSVWGLNAFGYRLFQLIFHLFNVVLVFFLLKKIFADQSAKRENQAAFLAALFFAIHPANVESVAYIGSIGEIFYAFFILLGMLVFIKGADYKNRAVKNRNFYAFFLFVFLGLLSKETAIVALPIIFIYLLLFVRPRLITYIRFFLGSGIVSGTYLFLRIYAAKLFLAHFPAPIAHAPLWQRLLTIPCEVISYLGVIFFPYDLSVSRQFVAAAISDPRFWAASLVLAAIGAAAALCAIKTKSKIALFFLLWFIVALVPALNIIPLDASIAERWLYVPIIGITAIAGYAASSFINGFSETGRKIAYALFGLLIVILGARTIARNADWKNGLTLFSHDYKIVSRISPRGSFDLENNYGVELLRAGKIDEAERHLRKSVALQPKWGSSQNNLGAVLQKQGDLKGALAHYKESIKIGKRYGAYENAGSLLIKLKRYKEAKTLLSEAITRFPKNNKLKLLLAELYVSGGEKGDTKKAQALLEQIFNDDPQNAAAGQLYYSIQKSR